MLTSRTLNTMKINRQILLLTAASALGSRCQGFVPLLVQYKSPHVAVHPNVHYNTHQTRLYSSDDSGIFGGLKKVAKSVLPTSWTQTEQERKVALARKEAKDQVSSGIQEMLKGAPLPVRMMGSMIAPLISSAAAGLQEQQQQTQDLLEDARMYIAADSAAMSALGEPIMCEPPFSQSSSSVSINGQMTSQVQAQFPVQGTLQQGIATMTATGDGIQQLVLQVGGRNMNIGLNAKSSSASSVFGGSSSRTSNVNSGGLGKNSINKGDIIDVEFVEKDDKRS